MARILILLTVVVTGCYSGQPQFGLNELHVLKREREYREDFTRNRRRELGDTLVRLLGTPDEPRLPDAVAAGLVGVLDPAQLVLAAGPVASDESEKRFETELTVANGQLESGPPPTGGGSSEPRVVRAPQVASERGLRPLKTESERHAERDSKGSRAREGTC